MFARHTAMDAASDNHDPAACEPTASGGGVVLDPDPGLDLVTPGESPIHRVRPRGMRPGGTLRTHWVSLTLGLPMTLGFLVLGALNLPQGLFLWLLAVIAGTWTWLSVGALRAHATLRGLERDGHLVTGYVVAVERAPETCAVTYRYDAEAWSEETESPAGPAQTWTQTTSSLSVWQASRYQPEMRVAVLIAPAEPGAGVLYPPPGGGAPLDLLGDGVAWLIQRFAADEEPEVAGRQSAPSPEAAAVPPPARAGEALEEPVPRRASAAEAAVSPTPEAEAASLPPEPPSEGGSGPIR